MENKPKKLLSQIIDIEKIKDDYYFCLINLNLIKNINEKVWIKNLSCLNFNEKALLIENYFYNLESIKEITIFNKNIKEKQSILLEYLKKEDFCIITNDIKNDLNYPEINEDKEKCKTFLKETIEKNLYELKESIKNDNFKLEDIENKIKLINIKFKENFENNT